MDRYEVTYAPKKPPKRMLVPETRSAALWTLIASLVAFFTLIGVVLLFWNVSHPGPSAQDERARARAESGYYSTEGGHNPAGRPGSTRDELRFRGALTPPSEARGR